MSAWQILFYRMFINAAFQLPRNNNKKDESQIINFTMLTLIELGNFFEEFLLRLGNISFGICFFFFFDTGCSFHVEHLGTCDALAAVGVAMTTRRILAPKEIRFTLIWVDNWGRDSICQVESARGCRACLLSISMQLIASSLISPSHSSLFSSRFRSPTYDISEMATRCRFLV